MLSPSLVIRLPLAMVPLPASSTDKERFPISAGTSLTLMYSTCVSTLPLSVVIVRVVKKAPAPEFGLNVKLSRALLTSSSVPLRIISLVFKPLMMTRVYGIIPRVATSLDTAIARVTVASAPPPPGSPICISGTASIPSPTLILYLTGRISISNCVAAIPPPAPSEIVKPKPVPDVCPPS